MNWAQIAVIVILAMDAGCSIALHGKPKTGNNNVFVTLIGHAIWLVLLWYGGFWR